MSRPATFRASTLALALVCLAAWSARAQPPAADHPYEPTVAPPSPDAAQALKSFRLAPGVKAGLFAAEPLLANPVAFGFDEKGRVFVVETFRLHHGVTDTRGHMNWLDDDLASRTVADRVAKYRKFLGAKGAEDYGKEHDRIRLLEDRDGDGKADHATVFADGFSNIPDGLAAGVLARHGDVYFTCIPDLWLLKDTNGDGKADVKKSLGYGFGVHTGFLGHDLHGLKFGPDGKLYFSIGDRGTNVKAVDGRTVFLPDTGAVFRCDPDGSNLEVFATGLRNPQELAFDEFGNLFTVDNNSDSGDKARLTYIMEGGDHGWTMGWQYLEKPVSRGPWNAEKLWYPAFEGQAADIVPPVANLTDGPSGLVYNPGSTLLPARYLRHFFVADFRGSAGQSGVRAFAVKPKGAGFALGENDQLIWGLEATDVDFGPDGAFYVSDWVTGWDVTGKGRIYKLSDPTVDPAAAKRVKTLLAEGFASRPVDELTKLLADPDQRVRQEAQFALAARGPSALRDLKGVRGDRLARVHAVWAVGQILRKFPGSGSEAFAQLVLALYDPDDEVAAQAARALGDSRNGDATTVLIKAVNTRSPRVQSLAAIALGMIGKAEAVAPLLDLLRRNADADPFLRHAAVMGLVGSNGGDALTKAAADPSRSVRLGVLLAWRRLKNPEVARFLDDADPRLITEAARAIYDAPVDDAIPKLADVASTVHFRDHTVSDDAAASPKFANLARLGRSNLPVPALRRAMNAAARAGRPEDARALASVASDQGVPEAVRVEAVELLSEWPKPPGRDRVTGLWRPRRSRPAAEAAAVLASVFPALVDGPSASLRTAALKAAGPLPVPGAGALLLKVVNDPNRWSTDRAEALRGLERLNDPKLAEAVNKAVDDPQSSVRVEGRRLLAKLEPAKALPLLAKVLETGSVVEKQGAFATLAGMPGTASDPVLSEWLDRLTAGKGVAPEVELDLLDAARARAASADIASKLKALDASRPKDDPTADYRGALVGGSASRGSKILREKSEVQCIRCHMVNGKGGEVGPDLKGVAGRGDRRYLLESIVAPNKQIAKGFETLLVGTTDGQVHSGILKEETDSTVRLMTAEGRLETIPKADIEERKRGASAMPEDLVKFLSRAEVRDLVEYLSTLK